MIVPDCNLPFEEPAVYQIKVNSRLSESIVERLPGFCIVEQSRTDRQDSECECNILEGRIQDQAGLMGVLDILHSYHYSIIDVRVISANEESRA